MISPTKLTKYRKNLNYSYTLGVFPIIELLTSKPTIVSFILFKSTGLHNKGIDKIIKICDKIGIKTITSDKKLYKITKKENIYAVGVFRKYKSSLEENKNHVVLVNPSNNGNLGTIIRTMVGFNLYNLGIIKPSADVFNPEVIRASMGSLFQVNFEYFNTIEEYRFKYKNTIYPFMTDGRNLLNNFHFKKPAALVFGNEAAGLPPEYKELGNTVKILQSKQIDSFNLAISVGISLYEFSN